MAAFFADLQRHPAATRPAKTEADILEIPFVAALLIVDDQISVLQPDFVEVLSVEPGQAQAVEPVEPGKQSAGRIAAPGSRWRGTGRGSARQWRGSRRRHRRGALGQGRRSAGLPLRGDAGGERSFGVTGRDGNIAIRRNAHREFGINEIEALGTKLPHQQGGAGKFHLGFWRGCDDDVVAIPDDDIADTHGDPDPAGTLDLGAAHFDGIAVTDILLDRSRKPWRSHFEIDRTGAEPPPQPAEAACKDHHQNRDHDGEALYPAFAGEPSA
jgi:hypothetical protein